MDVHLQGPQKPIEDWQERYVFEEDRPCARDAVAEAIRTKSSLELEHRVYLADGNIGWILSRAILVVEDECMLADELCRELESEGAMVAAVVGTCEDALAVLEADGHIDCAVVDVNLGGDPV